MNTRLTDSDIKRLEPPAKGNRIIFDDKVSGLGIRITAGGARSFVLNYRTRLGQQRRYSRALYDELVEAELGAYLAAHPSSFNIIVCCDTLVYIGQLEDTIAAAATALQPDGLLLFTLEHLAEGGEDRRYRLAPTGRFSHSIAYVRATLANAGLVDIIADPIIPRLECGEPVLGLLVMARSSPRKTATRLQARKALWHEPIWGRKAMPCMKRREFIAMLGGATAA